MRASARVCMRTCVCALALTRAGMRQEQERAQEPYLVVLVSEGALGAKVQSALVCDDEGINPGDDALEHTREIRTIRLNHPLFSRHAVLHACKSKVRVFEWRACMCVYARTRMCECVCMRV